MTRYIFTVAAGRSGQSSLTDLLDRHVFDCWAAVEEPKVDCVLPGRWGQYERRFRRRFFETHELLGRGKVLQAYSEGNDDYLEQIVRQKLRNIQRKLRRRDASIYIDVSKYFARGQHLGYLKVLPQFSLIHLVRDPLKNMRSFLNRNKDFYLDNGPPDSKFNHLRLKASDLNKGELYLWAWCELHLRFQALAADAKVDKAIEIRTDDLTNEDKMTALLKALDLRHKPLELTPPMNTNVFLGFPETKVQVEDVELFRQFVQKIPGEQFDRIQYFHDYDPNSALPRG